MKKLLVVTLAVPFNFNMYIVYSACLTDNMSAFRVFVKKETDIFRLTRQKYPSCDDMYTAFAMKRALACFGGRRGKLPPPNHYRTIFCGAWSDDVSIPRIVYNRRIPIDEQRTVQKSRFSGRFPLKVLERRLAACRACRFLLHFGIGMQKPQFMGCWEHSVQWSLQGKKVPVTLSVPALSATSTLEILGVKRNKLLAGLSPHDPCLFSGQRSI
jgi:hypothetical protein